MNKTIRILLGIAISAVCLWFVFRGFNFNELSRVIASASYVWFLPAAIIFVLNMMLRSLRWRVLLSPLKKIPFLTIAPTLIVGFFMNIILPARGGEFVRTVALSKKSGLPVSSVLGSVVAERLADMSGLLMILVMASRLLSWEKLPLKPIVSILTLGVAVCIGFVIFSKQYRASGENPSWVQKLVLLVNQLTEGFSVLRSPSKIFSVFGLSLIVWSGELLMAYLISRAVFLNLNIFESAGLITGVSVGVMIPAAPGYVGTYEFFGKSVLMLLGKPEAASLGFVLILHFFQIVMMALITIPSFFMLSRISPADA